ncbi:MAG: sporulation protein YqfD [Clostridia bacterium]|nr:sporulation protein YqfD [Clostridia bacterium]
MKKLFSYNKLIISSNDKNKAISLIVNGNFSCLESGVNENRELEILIPKKQIKEIRKLFDDYGISVKVVEIPGILKIAENLKHRWGILIGLLISVMILTVSSNFVWKIDIEGNHNVADEDILCELQNAGLTLGTFIPKIDYDNLHNKILLNSEELSWVSVNINGTIATVKVKEKEKIAEKKEPSYANIVAKYDGYIASVFVKNGKKIVSSGDIVKKGDVLISGVINSQSQGVRYESADGEVMAYINKEINIKLPFKETIKTYTGNVINKKCYKIYNFPLNFSIKYRNPDGFYDTIEKKENISLLGISDIPVEIITTTYYEYFLEDVCYTKSQIADSAFSELRKQMDIQLKDSELISKKINVHFDGDYFYLDCELYCLEDIAIEKEYFLTE